MVLFVALKALAGTLAELEKELALAKLSPLELCAWKASKNMFLDLFDATESLGAIKLPDSGSMLGVVITFADTAKLIENT
jgi:hypothetical protein